jgi:hypothetical protein
MAKLTGTIVGIFIIAAKTSLSYALSIHSSKDKVKFALQAMKAQRGSRGIALLSL